MKYPLKIECLHVTVEFNIEFFLYLGSYFAKCLPKDGWSRFRRWCISDSGGRHFSKLNAYEVHIPVYLPLLADLVHAELSQNVLLQAGEVWLYEKCFTKWPPKLKRK